jgi:hypothetical protein
MATQQATEVHYYIGFSDEICIVAKKPYREVRHLHLNNSRVVLGDNFSDAVVHLVGNWWLSDNAIEVRSEVLNCPNTTLIIHPQYELSREIRFK